MRRFERLRKRALIKIRLVLAWRWGSCTTRERFDVFSSRLPGFTRRRRREIQSQLDIQPLVAFEVHALLASPLVWAFGHRFRSAYLSTRAIAGTRRSVTTIPQLSATAPTKTMAPLAIGPSANASSANWSQTTTG
jgi:hypothetical protein